MSEECNPMTDDLVERLRNRNGNAAGFGIGPVCDEAADALEAKDAEIARLREDAERWREYMERVRLADECERGLEG